MFTQPPTMSAPPRRKHWTLDQLATLYGPIEIQRPVSKADFMALAAEYPNLRMEREPNGSVTIMAPSKEGSSHRESQLFGLLFLWNHLHGQGKVHGPNGTYDLPNGATRMPDASWISSARADESPGAEDRYINTVPDFVAEIRPQSDRLPKLQAKMRDTWMANGVRLAWLIDPYEEKAYIYRAGTDALEVVEGFEGKELSGETVLPGFSLPLAEMKKRD